VGRTKKATEPNLDHIAEELRALARPLADLVEDPANARLHGSRNLEAIKASLRRFGQRRPIVVRREGMVVEAGNGTLRAARDLGWTHLAYVLVDDDASTATGYGIADNRTAELAQWDDQVLGELLRSQPEDQVAACGFSDVEIARLTVPKAPREEKRGEGRSVQLGDVIELGPHRLICGDSTDPAVVTKILAGERPLLQIFDPPFDQDYSSWSLEDVDCAAVWLGSGSNGLFWSAQTFSEHARHDYVWHVSEIVFYGQGKGQHNEKLPFRNHECLHMWRRKDRPKHLDPLVIASSTLEKTVDNRPMSVNGGMCWRQHGSKMGKPLAASELIMSYVPKGGLIWDPCAGSGSALVAAELHGRRWLGAEINPEQCTNIIARFNGILKS
jgi:site-specific DNA-methyltransferase (adenine-specific)